MTNSLLKRDAITIAKLMLAQLPFNTIYSYADTLFDEPNSLSFGDAKLSTQVKFLKATKLSDIVFENTDAPDRFLIKNKDTGESIQVSNRMSSRGELRGKILRDCLEAEKSKVPDQTVYKTISRAIKNPQYSDMVTMFKAALTGDSAKHNYEGDAMSEEHFQLFLNVLLHKINEKIQAGKLSQKLEPKNIRDDQTLQNSIWEGIDVERIYDTTYLLTSSGFNFYLQQIKDKADNLQARGYGKASQAVNTLYKQLNEQKNDFINGKTNTTDFSTNCKELIEQAQEGELKNHRSFFGKLFNNLLKVLNIITFGLIPTKPTDSIKTTNRMKETLKEFLHSDQSKVTPLSRPGN